MSDFRKRLIETILENCNNDYESNFDPWFLSSKFQIRKEKPIKNIKDKLIIRRIGKYYSSKFRLSQILENLLNVMDELHHYEILYDLLEDQTSKKTLLEISALKAMGTQHVRLSIENANYENLHRTVESCLINKNSKTIHSFNDWKLNLYDLKNLGYDVKLHYTQMGIVTTFGVEQYALPQSDVVVKDNDTVIDCGGCWGDTALYFSKKAKNTHVYSFEFIPSNMEILNENIRLNENCDVTLIPNPVWKDSSSKFYAVDKGPSSSVSTEPNGPDCIEIQSLCIDDLVNQYDISKVDFIKMDIEGTEPYALEGAKETLIRFKPKLAIAIYHCAEDFSRIALFIKNLNLGYKFYLGHFTPHGAETILFAKTN
jgi:FkbM family methyltransferase